MHNLWIARLAVKPPLGIVPANLVSVLQFTVLVEHTPLNRLARMILNLAADDLTLHGAVRMVIA